MVPFFCGKGDGGNRSVLYNDAAGGINLILRVVQELGEYGSDPRAVEAVGCQLRNTVGDPERYDFEISAAVGGFIVLNDNAVTGEGIVLIHDEVAEAVEDNAVAVFFNGLQTV